MNPPDHALVFCLDEKSQIQALDLNQPGLPMKKGLAGTMTHDTSATHHHAVRRARRAQRRSHRALHGRHRHQEFLSFLKTIDHRTPHISTSTAADNYAPTKTEVNTGSPTPALLLPFHSDIVIWLNLQRFRQDHHRRIPACFTSVPQLNAPSHYIHTTTTKPFSTKPQHIIPINARPLPPN